MLRKTKYAVLVVLSFTALMGRAEEIRLKDGTKTSGRITAVDGDKFQVKTAYGEIQIPRDQIVSINFPENDPKNEASSSEANDARVIDESLVGTTYINRTEKFQLTVPQGWALAPEMRKQTKDIAAALKSPDQTLFFIVTPEVFVGTVATYEVLAETNYQMKFKDYEKLSQSEIQIDGKKSIRIIWHGKNRAANDSPVKSLVFVIPYEGRMVRLSFLTLEPLFDDAVPAFEKIAASFHLTASSK